MCDKKIPKAGDMVLYVGDKIPKKYYTIREIQMDIIQEHSVVSVDDIPGWIPIADFNMVIK